MEAGRDWARGDPKRPFESGTRRNRYSTAAGRNRSSLKAAME